jgi:hypothetical protein
MSTILKDWVVEMTDLIIVAVVTLVAAVVVEATFPRVEQAEEIVDIKEIVTTDVTVKTKVIFHQHFTSSFCTNILLTKNYKFNCNERKASKSTS